MKLKIRGWGGGMEMAEVRSEATRNALGLLAALSLYVALLLAIVISNSPSTVDRIFSEDGFFENASIVLWAAAAGLSLVYVRRNVWKATALSAMFLLFATREADLHKAFTSRSFIKIHYFREGMGLEQGLAGGLIAVAVLLIVFFVLWLVHYIFFEKGWAHFAGQCAILACALLVGTKIIDRAPSLLRGEFGIHLSTLEGDIFVGLEEGLEMIVPLLLTIALAVRPNFFDHTAST